MRPLKPLTVLRRLRKLFSVKERWTKYMCAVDKNGHPELSRSPDAVSWCLSGSCKKYEDGLDTWLLLAEQAERNDPIYVNDILGYEAVLALLDRTIAAERAKGET